MQFYTMAHGDEQVLSGPVDLALYLDLISAKQIDELVQPQINNYFHLRPTSKYQTSDGLKDHLRWKIRTAQTLASDLTY